MGDLIFKPRHRLILLHSSACILVTFWNTTCVTGDKYRGLACHQSPEAPLSSTLSKKHRRGYPWVMEKACLGMRKAMWSVWHWVERGPERWDFHRQRLGDSTSQMRRKIRAFSGQMMHLGEWVILNRVEGDKLDPQHENNNR